MAKEDSGIPVGKIGTSSYRVIQSASRSTPTSGLPPSMLAGRGRLALSGSEYRSRVGRAKVGVCPEVARASHVIRHENLHSNYATAMSDLDLAAARMYYNDTYNSYGDRVFKNGYGLGSHEQLAHLDYVPRRDLIYPSRAASILQLHHPEYRMREELMVGTSLLPAEDRLMAQTANDVRQAARLRGPEADLLVEPLPMYLDAQLHAQAQYDGYQAACKTASNAPKSDM
eukprot:TRINITY_DN14907_c0_g1_i2.p1 TRINITY_DN14907_c0_g1~~TRINITY_DN14907_c0_g1_i2.p1  ORF type:complete len:228 (-),score=53.06 TRINITY_DN14907_c0_g1_i2:355-1038(-)